jgi:hypothetical protein
MDVTTPGIALAELAPITSLEELLGPDHKQRIAAEIRAMERMGTGERVAAMYRGELRGPALRAWATSRPHEIPLTSLAGAEDTGAEGATYIPVDHGEYPWLLQHTPEFCGD